MWAAFLQNPYHVPIVLALGIALTVGLTWLIFGFRRPSAEEIERRRRERLASIGRITDGHLVDARRLDGEESVAEPPEVLFYSYKLAGVTYNCAQDVSSLTVQVQDYKLDQPLQVRYDPRNPGNSIVVSESWTGLWERRAYPRNGKNGNGGPANGTMGSFR